MPRHEFERVLLTGEEEIQGVIALIAEILKNVCAEKHPMLATHDYTTIIDCKSLFLSRAMPTRHAFGHATATLIDNTRFGTREGTRYYSISARLNKLTYTYCRCVRDFARIATPTRWPKGSPALASLNQRQVPLISSGIWKGGRDHEVVMNILWDTINNWGLRGGMNDAICYTPVPLNVRDLPLKKDSALAETR